MHLRVSVEISESESNFHWSSLIPYHLFHLPKHQTNKTFLMFCFRAQTFFFSCVGFSKYFEIFSDILLLLKYFLYCKCHKRQFYTAELRLLCAWSKFSVGTMQHKSQNKLSLLTPTSACSLKVYALYWCINIMHHIVLHLCCLLPALNYGKPFLPWKKNYKKGIFNFLSELISCNSEWVYISQFWGKDQNCEI